ncbi:MAG TPA: Ig-like domain-containing protein [Anaerolineales bacterium]|nr:Ig-like domain-containing protein [Anaerolineales bacterium]
MNNAPQDSGVEDAPVAQAGKVFVFQRNYGELGLDPIPDAWGEVVVLQSSDAATGDYFGKAVAISGDTIAVGAPGEDGGMEDPLADSGAVYIYQRNLGGEDMWGEVTTVYAPDAQLADQFGTALALDGDTLVVGAPKRDDGSTEDSGAFYIFNRNLDGPDTWGFVIMQYQSGYWEQFGASLALDGGILVVGSPGYYSGSGAVSVYYRNWGGPDMWGSVAPHLIASDGDMDDRFGESVAIQGDTIVVGAPLEDGGDGSPLTDSGSAYVLGRNQGDPDAWGQVTILRASNAQAGDYFGQSVAINTDTIVVGAPGQDTDLENPMLDTGAAYVFNRSQGGVDAWVETRVLYASDTPFYAGFGWSLALFGNTLVVGAPELAISPYDRVGAAYVFNTSGTWLEAASLQAGDAQADDLFGWTVDVDGDTLVVGAQHEDGGFGGSYPDGGAVYVFQRSQAATNTWDQTAVLSGSQMQAYDYFGYAVAISGNTIVVGAYGAEGPGMENSAGIAYVYERHYSFPDHWDEVAVLTPTNPIIDDAMFGYSVDIEGDIVVVGAPGANTNAGACFVFGRNVGWDDAWGLVTWMGLYSPGEYFGLSVAVAGDTIAVGTPGDAGADDLTPGAGAVYLFQQNLGGADHWGSLDIVRSQETQAWDGFGTDVALSGSILVVGAPYEDGGMGDPRSDAGAAYVFYQNQGGYDYWDQVAVLRASDAQADDRFAASVSVSDDVIVAGAADEKGGPGDPIQGAGAAYVFQRNQGGAEAWGQVRTLRASDAQELDWFGISAAIDGNTIVVGAHGRDGELPNEGAAYVFTLQANWVPEALPLPPEAQAGDLFGSVALDGDILVVGAPEADVCPITEPITDTGAAYVFTRLPGGWRQDAILCAPDPQAGDHFGFSVAISGVTIVVGAYGRDGDTGAAYVFEYTDLQGINDWSQVGTLGVGGGQAGDGFGYSVAVQGAEIIVGAPWADGTQADEGAAYVFGNSPTLNAGLDDWSQVGTLGSENPQANGLYGYALGLDGNLLAVGAPGEDQAGGTPVTDAGVVYVYTSGAGVTLDGAAPEDWSQVGTLGAEGDAGQGDGFGTAVALQGSRLIVGAPGEDGAGEVLTDTGIAYVFTITPTLTLLAGMGPIPEDWSQVGTLGVGSGANAGDGFGSALAFSGQAIIVGAPYADIVSTETITDSGAAYAFVLDAGSWYLLQTLRSADAQEEGHFGSLVALDGEWAAVGAPNEDARFAVPITDTGAAYTFKLVLPNAAPLALDDDTTVVADGTGHLLDVLANDSDPNNDLLVISAVDEPAQGVVLDNDLNLVYTPTLGVGGVDTFTYTVTDGNGGYATAQVTVSLEVPPVAEDLTFSTPKDTPHSDRLEASDVDSSVLTFTQHTLPVHGAVNIATSGVFTYTPGLGYVGTDVFTFTVSDGALTDTGRVDITVTAVNEAPIAFDQVITTSEEMAYTGVLTATDVDSPILTYTVVVSPQHGSVSIAAGGAFTYTPGLNYNGSDVFTFTVLDGALTDTGRVDITITAVNDAPLAIDQGIVTTEDTPYTGLLGASDAEDDPLAFSLGLAPQYGSVSITPGGTFTYTPAVDYHGMDLFAFVVSDGVLTDTGQVAVTVISADAATTTLSLTADPLPSAVGQVVTFTAVVSSSGNLNAVQAAPAGTIIFWDGPAALLTTTLDTGGAASFSTAGLALGEHAITAEYLGGPDHQPSSFTLTHTVAYIADLSTSITATLTPGHVVYTIVVTNGGFNDADGAAVSVNFPSHLTQLTWTCAAAGGATCTPSGSGTLQDVLASFPVGGMVTYTVNANRLELESQYTVVIATLPDGVIDLNPGDNQAHFPPGYRFLLPLVLRAQPQ